MFVRHGAINQITVSRHHHRGRGRVAFPFVFLFLAALFALGCKSEHPKRLSPSQVHGITREMVHASAGFGKKPGDIATQLQLTARMRIASIIFLWRRPRALASNPSENRWPA